MGQPAALALVFAAALSAVLGAERFLLWVRRARRRGRAGEAASRSPSPENGC